MAEDSYKNDMRRLIDIAKTMSFSSPLHSTLEDLKLLTTASKDLSDRIEMRVRNSLMKDDDKAKAKPKVINIAVEDKFYSKYGNQKSAWDYCGLSVKNIKQIIKKEMRILYGK